MSIIVLDFGSQYTQLITRRIRELHVYSEIKPCTATFEAIREFAPQGIILSGGPASCHDTDAPKVDRRLFELGVPVLGICYGLQTMGEALGGSVSPGSAREYGRSLLNLEDDGCPLWHGLNISASLSVWMSHGDHIAALPTGFKASALSENGIIAAVWHPEKSFFGVQFHPEVAHTPCGETILANFVHRICGAEPNWTMSSFVERQVVAIREQIGKDARLICGLSGGVDSSVAAMLIHQAAGERQTCVFVDNGLLREGEAAEVKRVFGDDFQLPLVCVDASERFLKRLKGVTDPERKRIIIGNEFVAVFDEEAQKLSPAAKFLVQGTLYPDVVESVSFKGPSATIKSHHNVGGLPEKMKMDLVEPLRELFKDEVRVMGEEIGLPRHLLWRQPFPGPGLAVRIVGEVTADGLAILRKADAIVEEEIRSAHLYDSIWQAFAVLLPVRSVGVMGDSRTYESTLVLRAVHSTDGMTADWAKLPYEVLGTISNRVINEVSGINRVVYDISSKPPATIEWE